MRKTAYVLLASALFFAGVPSAFANISIAPNAPTAPQAQFGFYCGPYAAPFVSGGYYTMPDPDACTYLLPAQQMASSSIFLAVYKGTPGNNPTLLNYDYGTLPNASVLQTSPDSWSSPSNGDDFFSVAVGYDNFNDVLNENNYFTSGGTAPVPYSLVQWKWGTAPAPADTQPPVITIVSPVDGSSYLQNDTVFISATATDTSGVASMSHTFNGAPIADPTQPLPLASAPLGTATLVVSATDTAGNTGYATSTFTVLPPDLTPPTITISSPLNGATYTDTSTVYLTSSVTDASGVAATSYTFDGNSIDPTVPLPLLGATLGPATVTVSATDMYGNAASSTVTFTIKSPDVTPPTITITKPAAGASYLSTDTVVPVVSVTDASGVATSSYLLDTVPIDPTQPLPLSSVPSGSATFSVSATDNFGNATTSSVAFTIIAPPAPDTQPPVITITSPVSGKLYARSDTVYLTATITDQSAVPHKLYYFDGKVIDPAQPLPLSTAPLGNASTTVVAIDAYGNKATATVNFRIVPAVGQCAADILDAYNHKLIPDKKTFARLFDDCQDLGQYNNDRNNYWNDDNNRHVSCTLDSRYLQAQANIGKTYGDIDSGINH